MSREKGVKFERLVAEILRRRWLLAKRGIGQARFHGETPDVEGTPWWVEAKHGKRVSVRAAYEQALAARAVCPRVDWRAHPVLVVSRENNGDVLVTLRLDDFLDALEKAGEPPDLGLGGPSPGG